MTDEKYSGMGVAAATLALLELGTCWIIFFMTFRYVEFFFVITYPLAILSITIGSIVYWGKEKDAVGMVGVAIAIIGLVLGLLFTFGIREIFWV